MNSSELKSKLLQMGVNSKAYRLYEDLHLADEEYCLEEDRGRWVVYYAERGQRSGPEEFDTESDACMRLLQLLESDESVFKH